MKKLHKQLLLIALTVSIFALLNFSIYMLLTRRLANNFSDTTQAKMIDVGMYLPHEKDSDLVRIDASLKLTDNLPVLDGATALLPVYAAIIDAVYPVGSVTYEGGSFIFISSVCGIIFRWSAYRIACSIIPCGCIPGLGGIKS